MLGSSYPTIYILFQVIATEMHPGTLRTSLTLAVKPLLGALFYFPRQECNLCLSQTPMSLSVDRGMQTGTQWVCRDRGRHVGGVKGIYLKFPL